LVLAFIFFCAILKWQPWHTRLHLPLFVLWSAAIGTVLARAWPWPVTISLSLLLLLLSTPVVLQNQLRPLIGNHNILNSDRISLYFPAFYFCDRTLRDSYKEAADFIMKGTCRDIGLDQSLWRYEYPLLVLLSADKIDMNVKQISVNNPSALYDRNQNSSSPCTIICLGCSKAPQKWEQYISVGGPASVFQDVVVFSSRGTYPDYHDYARPTNR